MQLVGFNARQVRDGVCQRGAAKRQGEQHPGPISPDTLAKNIVKRNLRELEALFNGAIRALAQAAVFGAKVTGMADGTDLETTERYRSCGQVTRKVRLADKHGQMHEIGVTGYGWKVLLLIDATTKIPLAVKVGKIDEHWEVELSMKLEKSVHRLDEVDFERPCSLKTLLHASLMASTIAALLAHTHHLKTRPPQASAPRTEAPLHPRRLALQRAVSCQSIAQTFDLQGVDAQRRWDKIAALLTHSGTDPH